MISDGSTTFKMVKDITKRYLARERENTPKINTTHVCPPDLGPKVKELKDKILQMEMDFEDEKTQIEFDHEN